MSYSKRENQVKFDLKPSNFHPLTSVMGCRQQWDLIKSRKYQQVIVKTKAQKH